jgi:class 3 adenylate cyclase/predicted ATPase
MDSHTFTRKLAAILSAEIQGYNHLVNEDGAITLPTLMTYQELVVSLIHRYRGRVVNSSSDNLLAEFDSVVEALRCAVALQQDRKQHNASLPVRQRIEFGMGLNLGDVLRDTGQADEEGVNIAAYLKSLAEGGGICISGTVYDQVETKLPLEYEDLGEQEVPNVAKPVRAYRVQWETEHSVIPDQPTPHHQFNPSWPDDPRNIGTVRLVGRETDLARLQQGLEKALSGERQVLFLTGEPGIGKTTVVEAFLAQHSRSLIPSFLIAQGQCVEHYGAGEAYLPVLEALGRLGREPGHHQVIAILAQYAPTWLAQLPALANLSEREDLQRTLMGATRERMLRELTDALEALATHHPVVIVLEDLHWSDHSTVELVAYLAQRRGPARLLLIGTYRPVDIQTSAHPLKGVVQELQARGRCEELRLEVLRKTEVGTYIQERFGDSSLPTTLAGLIHQRTGGNPLFMVNMIEHFLHEGVIAEADGRWRVCQDVSTAEVGVPDNLRRLIEKQLERLDVEEQRVLAVGSVAGMEFAVATVAAALAQEIEEVEKQCAGLAAKGQFIRAVGVEEWPDGTIAGRYSFIHALYQNVVYERVAAVRRIGLHRRIGERKEAAYGQRTAEIASELAVHFAKGRDQRRAVHYLEQAGRNAIRRHAHQEAIGHLTNALDLLRVLPETPERTRQELTLRLTLVGPLLTVKGYTSPEVEKTYTQARELCRQLGDLPHPFSSVLFGLSIFHQLRGELHVGRELAEQLLTLAQSGPNPTLLLWAHMALGNALYFLGDFVAARDHLHQGLTFYLPHKHSPSVTNIAQDLGVICLSRSALTLWFLGYPDQARLSSDKGLTAAQELSHPFSQAFALHAAAGVHRECRELQAGQKQVERLVALSEEYGFPYYSTWGTILQGWLRTVQEKEEVGVTRMHQGLAALRTTGSALGLLFFDALLAEAYGQVGQTATGLAVLTEGLEVASKTGEQFYAAELYRLKGTLTLQSQVSSPKSQGEEAAEVCFQKAIDIARRQQAKALELRAVMSLARLWQQQGKIAEARQLLEEIYAWFTEGFDTRDLQDANALLMALGGRTDEPQSRQPSKSPSAGRKTFPSRAATSPLCTETYTSSASHPLPENLFRNEGEYWTLAFQGTLCRVKDIRGMHHLAQLLKNPHKELHALALVHSSANAQGEEPAKSSSEQARVNVTRAIKAAIKKITASHPALGQHLLHAIKTGTLCSYTPDPQQPCPWRV